MDLRYRLAVVTGAGGGLGREIAVALSRVGAAVLLVDRDLAAAEETADRVREARARAWPLQADVTDVVDLRSVAAYARDLGGADLLVNNAGGWTPGDSQWPDAAAEDWCRTLDLNLRAPMLLTQLFVEALPQRRGRRDGTPAVVNVSSSAAIGDAGYGSPEYAAAKAGLSRFTTASSDPATTGGARVMCVVPGWVGLDRAQRQWADLPRASVSDCRRWCHRPRCPVRCCACCPTARPARLSSCSAGRAPYVGPFRARWRTGLAVACRTCLGP